MVRWNSSHASSISRSPWPSLGGSARLGSSRSFTMSRSLPVRPVRARGLFAPPPGPGGPGPGLAPRRRRGHALAGAPAPDRATRPRAQRPHRHPKGDGHGTCMAAQISQFSNCIQRKMIKSFGEITAGQRARRSRRGLITQRYENRSTSVSDRRIFAFENQLLETGSVARPTPRPRPAQPGTLEPRDPPPHRRRRHLPRPRGPDPPRRCSPSRTTRRMDLRCAATSASTSSPRAG